MDNEDSKRWAADVAYEEEAGAGAAAEGVPALSDRPCFRVFDEWIEHQDGKLRPGAWFFGAKEGRKAEDPRGGPAF